jgi:alpha-tubulin suppressor-like RCC1 family protein
MRFQILVAVLLLAITVEASHFRGAFYSWRRSNLPSHPLTVEFTTTVAWRANITSAGAYKFSAANDQIVFNWGDSSADSRTLQGPPILDNFDVTGEYIIVRDKINHTFPLASVYTVTWNSFLPTSNYGARALFPNTQPYSGASYGSPAYISSVVDLTSGYDSPIAQIPLVLQLPISQPGFFATYQLPVADPAGLEFSCSLASRAQSGINFQANVTSGTITVTSGCEIKWDTSAGKNGQAWAVQVTLSQAGTFATIPLDFVVVLVQGNFTPVCTASTTETVIVPPGSNYTFVFHGYSPDSTYLILKANQLTSQDGVFLPALPINGSVIGDGTPGANFTLEFVVSPQQTQTAELMTIEITNSLGYQTYCSASFQGQAPHAAPTCNSTQLAPSLVPVGTSATVTITGYTLNPVLTKLNVSALLTHSDVVIPDDGKSVGLPANVAITATPTAPGVENVTIQFKDATNLEAQCTAQFFYIAAPTCVITVNVPLQSGIATTIVGNDITGSVVSSSTNPSVVPTTLTLTDPNFPSYGTYTPLGNGSATFILDSSTPVSNNYTFTVTDNYGQSGSCSIDYQFLPVPTTQPPTTIPPTTQIPTTQPTTVAPVTTKAPTVAATTKAPTVTTKAPTTGPAPTSGPSCPSGSFLEANNFCAQSNLLTAFGEECHGGMGVGAVGASCIIKSPTLVPYIPNENVIKIQTGPRHSSIVTNVGNVYQAGLNGNGQLGVNSTANHENFVLVAYFVNNSLTVKEAFPGGYHTIILLDNNQVWGYGLNSNGQLGQGAGGLYQYTLPVQIIIPDLNGEVITGVTAAFQHSLVMSNTRVWAFGSGQYDQVGAGSNRVTPTVVFDATSIGSTIQQVTAGGYSSAFLTGNGFVYTFGRNLYGNLGLGNNVNTAKPTQVKFPTGTVIDFVSSAEKHSLFLTTDTPPILYAVGDNSCGNLGTSGTDNHNSPIRITFFDTQLQSGESIVSKGVGTGWSHSLVWTQLNLFTFGCDSDFNLGIPQTGSAPNIVSTPVPNKFYNSSNVVVQADCKGHYSLVLSQLGSQAS